MTRRQGNDRRIGAGVVAALIAGACTWTTLGVVAPVHAAGETIISTFYVPLFEDNARAALFAVNSGTGTNLSSTTSVTIGAEGAIIYYDHWEDGYEPLANDRTQATTLLLGDGNTANGDAATYCVPARCAGDYLPAGAVLRLNNSTTVVPGVVATPRTTGIVVFDGRDKLSSTEGLAVTHATWPTAIDALHSEMAAAFDTSRWGVNFSAPVGVNTPAQGSGTTSFNYTGMEVMAAEAGTSVSIDANNDGDYLDANDHNGTVIGEGQVIYVNGNVNQGAKVVTTKPVQVFLMTGVIGSGYEDRSFQVFPTEGLVNDYVAPASTARGSGSYATVLYIFNPQTSAINVDVTTPSGTTTYSVPAGQTLNPAPYLAANQAARLTSAQTFAVVAGVGTRETSGNSRNYDWGYSPLPARLLVDNLVVGWAPGSQDLSAAGYDPIWATAVAPTTLYLDYDADPTTGANVDANGQRYDTTITIATALAMTRITDGTDRDMTGARVYTVDEVGISLAYGEDPASSTPVADPGIDLGSTQFPACGALCIRKESSISIDLDGDGLVDPGDTLQWVVTATNTDYYALVFPVLLDILPPTVSYVPGSSTVQINTDPPSSLADDVVPPATSLFPFDESGRLLAASIAVGGQVTVTFDTIVDPGFSGTTAICNRALVTSERETILTDANGADSGCVPVDGLRVTKTSDSGGDPVEPGQTLTYTIEIENTSTSEMAPVDVSDPLAAGLTWDSTTVTAPTDDPDTVGDNFETSGTWGGGTGSLTWSAGAWTETDSLDSLTSTSTGYVQKVTDGGDLSLFFDQESNSGDGLRRLVGDLSAYTSASVSIDRLCDSMDNGDAVSVRVRPNGSAAWTSVLTMNNCDDAIYQTVTASVPAALLGTATELAVEVTDSFSNSGGDFIYLDNLVLTVNSRTITTTAGSPAPDVASIANLLPGESATVVITAIVDDPYTATDELTNVVTVRSGNQVAQASVYDCVRCFDFGDDPATFDVTGVPGPSRARATSQRAYIADTFQSLGYAGDTGTVDFSGDWVETDGSGGGATGGLVQNAADVATRSLRIGSTGGATVANTAATRTVGDLDAASEVVLGFDYRCSNLGTTDTVQLQIRPTSSAAWTTLQSFTECNHATIYSDQRLTLDAADYGTSTEIRLIVSQDLESGELFYFDDIQFRVTYDSVTVGPRLGTLLDREIAGAGGAAPFPATAPATPNGDDTSATDDEDGVTVPSVDTETLVLPIEITDDTGGTSYVNGWMDWDNDGVFQADESIFASGTFASATGGLTVSGGAGEVPGPGTYDVTVNVPDLTGSHTIGGTLYSRFRVATQLSGVSSAVGASLDGEIEDYASSLNTLPVDLAYVSSRRSGGTVALTWRTAQEVDNLGFDVYASGPNGTLTKLTTAIVPSTGPTSVESQRYQLKLSTRASQLWLEDISLDGVRELHGPYRVGRSYGDPNPPAPIDWDAAADALAASSADDAAAVAAAAREASQRRQAAPATPEYGPVATFSVTEDGIQQITYDDLLAAGVDLNGVPAALLALTSPDGPVAIEVTGAEAFGPGSAVRFLGQPLDTIYTGANVYRLHLDPALALRIRKADVSGGRPRRPGVAPTVVPVTTHTELLEVHDNVEYSITTPGDDPWYDALMVAIGGPSTTSKVVTLDHLVPGQPVSVSVDMWGITRDAIDDEHHALLRANGQVVGEGWFDDNQTFTLSGTVPAGVFVEGDNTLEVTLLGDTGVFIDIAVVDRWNVSYPRTAHATDGRLDATVTGARLDVSGLPAGPLVAYRVAADGTVVQVPTTVAGATVQLPGTNTAERFVVSAAGALRVPAVAPARPAAPLLDGTADYLIITHGMFTEGLAPLIAYHEGQGRTVKLVDVADIYEAYSHGVVDAAAIDAYLAAAVPALDATWVLLVGADSFDYRDYGGSGAFSLLPSIYGPTGLGVWHAPLDPAYADLDGDGVPDVALGRLPVRTPQELTLLITKTTAYAAAPPASAVLASDTSDGTDYAAVNDGLEALLDGWDVQRADVDRSVNAAAARADLLAAIDAGVGVTMYVGHSGPHTWTDLGLFDDDTAGALTNSAPTVVLQFGCWNTYYVAPDGDTLAHSLLLGPGGAAAVAGSTTMTSSASDIQLAELLTEQIAAGATTLGQAVLAAKRELARQAGGAVVDAQLGWTILGDPALPTGGLG